MVPLRNLKRFLDKTLRQPGYALKVGQKRLRSYASYYFGKGCSAPPEAVTFFLTRLCNLRCKMCGQWGDYGMTRTENAESLRCWLSFEEIKKVLDEIAPFRPSVTLFGGEPLLHLDVGGIVRYIKKLGLHGLMITNGTLLVPLAHDLVEAGFDELNVSIDGGRALHDEIRGLPGVFDGIMAGIAEVNKAKRAMSKNKPLINLQCTVSRYNQDRLDELVEVAKEAQADSLTFHNLIFLGRDLFLRQKKFDERLGCSSQDWQGFVFEPGINPQRLYDKIRGILDQKHSFAVDFYPNFSAKGVREYYENPDYLPSEYSARCLSPWVCVYIFPDGEARPCLNCNYSFGNVKRARFEEIWNSPQAVMYRRTLKKAGIFPVCRRCTELYRY